MRLHAKRTHGAAALPNQKHLLRPAKLTPELGRLALIPREKEFYFGQLQLLADPVFDEPFQLLRVSKASDVLDGAYHPLRHFHFALCRAMQNSPDQTLERFEKENRE